MSIRILLADDHAMLRAGLRALLSAEPDLEVVGEAGNGEEAVALAEQLRPDVVVMDISMPVLDGLEATRRIATDPRTALTRVLVLTTFDLDEYVFQALQAGASGFLLKDTQPADPLCQPTEEDCAHELAEITEGKDHADFRGCQLPFAHWRAWAGTTKQEPGSISYSLCCARTRTTLDRCGPATSWQTRLWQRRRP